MPQDPVSDQRSDPLGTAVDDLDSRLAALEKTGQWWPGMIGWTAASTAPQGWLVADGSDFDVDRYAALSAALGGASTLPDLRDRFPIGAGNTYALLAVGGASSVTLTGAQSGQPAIAAGTTGSTTPGSTGAGTAHSHAAPATSTGFITQTGGVVTFTGGGAGGVFGATATEAAHTHASAAHTHTTPAIAAANAAQSHSVLNPYVGLTPLIHI